MAEGNLAIATQNIASAGTYNFTVSDFTASDGTALGASDAVLIRSIFHGNDVTINRTGDPDDDSTFEINEQIDARSGAGERHSDTLIATDVAGVEVVNDAGSAQDVTMIAESVPASLVFVEQAAAVADASEVNRTTASRGSDETVIELLTSADADLDRRYDANDDGTFEIDVNVDSYVGSNVVTETWLSGVDAAGRSNAAMQTALVNTSGGTGDYMLLGTIGEP